MSDEAAPAQSALYHLARALIRSGAIQPEGLIEAARAVEREGGRDDPDSKPRLGVIVGGKKDGKKTDAP